MKIEKGKLYYDGLFKKVDLCTEDIIGADYHDRIAVRCDTQDDWDYVTEKLGYKWEITSNWLVYKEGTHIHLDHQAFCKNYVKMENYKLITIQDFLKFYPPTPMKKLTNSDPIWTPTTDRLKELHRSFTGKKNHLRSDYNYEDVTSFDNKNIGGVGFQFYASVGGFDLYKDIYTEVSEEEFIRITGIGNPKDHNTATILMGENPEQTSDPVNNPSHYNKGGIECIEAIKASMTPEAFNGYLKGNCQKYLFRYESKANPPEDLKKAQWYLTRLIKELGN